MIQAFLSHHGYLSAMPMWQSCEIRDRLTPIGHDPHVATIDSSGYISGFNLDLKDREENSFSGKSRLSSVFGSMTTSGIVTKSRKVYFHSGSNLFRENFCYCNDIHGSQWEIAGIDSLKNECLFYSIKEYALKKAFLPDDLLAVHCSSVDSNVYVAGKKHLWLIDFSEDVISPVRMLTFDSKCKFRLWGRSNNFSIISYGKKSVFLGPESAIALDNVPSLCYSLPSCVAFLMPYGWIFSSLKLEDSMMAWARKNFCNGSKKRCDIQSLIDPVFAIFAGLEDNCIFMSEKICIENRNALKHECVQKLLKDEPSYRILRLSK